MIRGVACKIVIIFEGLGCLGPEGRVPDGPVLLTDVISLTLEQAGGAVSIQRPSMFSCLSTRRQHCQLQRARESDNLSRDLMIANNDT